MGIQKVENYSEPMWLPKFEDEIVKQILIEDSLSKESDSPYRFAILRETNCDVNSFGSWGSTETHTVWQHAIECETALSLNAVFQELRMPEGAELFAYSPSSGWITGPITNKNFPMGEKEIATEVLNGNIICIVYKEPLGAEGERNIVLSKVGHGYRLLDESGLSQPQGASDRADAAACNVDITNNPSGNCFTMEKKAEALFLVNLNTEQCSGTMMNNTGFQTSLNPFYLTANHCLFTTTNPLNLTLFSAATSVLRFRFWTGNTFFISYTGLNFRVANGAISDGALLELTTPIDPSHEVFYAGWTRATTLLNSVGVHHPQGDRTKISFDAALSGTNLTPTAGGRFTLGIGTAFTVDFGQPGSGDFGTVEKGSSGSPLFNPAHLVIGSEKGSLAPGCSGSAGNAGLTYYGRISNAWGTAATPAVSLSPWLDPLGTNPTSHIGTFQLLTGSTKIPCANFVQNASAPSLSTNSSVAYTYTWTASPNIQITGTGAAVTYKALTTKPTGTIEWIECSISPPTGCGSSIVYQSVRRNLTWVAGGASLSLKQNGFNAPSSLCIGQSYSFNLAFSGGFPVPTGMTFNWTFSGGTFSATTSNGGQTVSIYVNGPASQSLTATCTIVGGTGCVTGFQTFYFYSTSCGGFKLSPQSDNTLQQVQLWPNPSRNAKTFYKIPKQFNLLETTLQLINLSGKIIWEGKPEDYSGELGVSNLQSGIYVLKVQDRDNQRIQKLTVQ
jgi:lysyl endopeptidase